MRVLIVDDGVAGDDLAHHLKTMYGAECFRARSVEDGLAQRKTIRALDFVVLDLSFPKTKREETIALIPQFRHDDGVSVFVYTGYDEKSLLQTSLENGATDWFLKGDENRGGSALANRMASLFYRQRHGSASPQQRDKIVSSLLEARKEQSVAMPREKKSWFSTAQAVITIAIMLVLQLIALAGFMYSQGASNALFRNRVEINTNEISAIKPQINELRDSAHESKQNRQNIEERVKQIDQRQMNSDTKLDQIRTDMNAGFQRIYEILLADRKTNADNRNTDQNQPRR